MAAVQQMPWFSLAEELWLAGHNNEQIGQRVGVSRERIRQVSHLFAPRRWQRAGFYGDLLDCVLLKQWAIKGYVTRSPGGFYDEDEVGSEIARRMSRQCGWRNCTSPVESLGLRVRLCPAHRGQTYRYPGMTPEQRKRFFRTQDAWKKRNRAAVRAIANRASRAYRARQVGLDAGGDRRIIGDD